MSKGYFIFCILILWSASIIAQKPGDKVLSVFVDEYNQQWFGTDKGLLRKCGDVWKAYNTQPGSPGIVNDLELQSMELAVIWIGTTKGIIKVNYTATEIRSAIFYDSLLTTFKSNNIRAIAFDNLSAGYFSTPAGIGVFTNAVWKFYTRLFEVFRNEFTSVKAKGDTIYFGTKGEGVARITRYLDGYTGASAYVTPWSALPGDSITCIFFDSKGHQWYGTNKGITRHIGNAAKEGWDFSLTDELPNQHVTAIAEDKQGNIWIGTRGGLVELGTDLNIINTWLVSNGLPSDVINDIYIGKDQTLWIGTDLGASHFNGSSFSNIRTSDFTKDFIDL
jgi:hypothetical protein